MSERVSETQEQITVEPVRDDIDSPCLEWVTIDHPDEMYVLADDDYVLDTYFNPEYDAWEALVLLRPGEEDDEDDE